MAGALGRILAGTWLAGSMLWGLPVGAQAGRPWSDPPADLNAGPLVPDAAPRTASAKPAQAWPDEAARRRPTQVAAPNAPSDPKETGSTRLAEPRRAPTRDVQETGSTRVAEPHRAPVPDVKATGSTQIAKKPEGSEPLALRRSTRKDTASARPSRDVREARVDQKPAVAAAPQKRHSQTARNNESDRVRTAQPAEYEVMRMRTLLYPDGRVVEVLSRPDQELVDLPMR